MKKRAFFGGLVTDGVSFIGTEILIQGVPIALCYAFQCSDFLLFESKDIKSFEILSVFKWIVPLLAFSL